MPVVRVSEIGEYLYCRRAWWLRRVRGEASANTLQLEAGLDAHAAHGRRRGLAAWLQVLAMILAVAAVLLFLWR